MAETFRNEYVRCGKSSCRSCPHGPYWYAYWREGKKVRKRYVGKADPRPGPGEPPTPPDARDVIFGPDATLAVAASILGVLPGADAETFRRAFRVQTLRHHPDRGGSHMEMARVNAAWAYVRAYLGIR